MIFVTLIFDTNTTILNDGGYNSSTTIYIDGTAWTSGVLGYSVGAYCGNTPIT